MWVTGRAAIVALADISLFWLRGAVQNTMVASQKMTHLIKIGEKVAKGVGTFGELNAREERNCTCYFSWCFAQIREKKLGSHSSREHPPLSI